mmetsp:Transcript_1704/g.2131  ORF Transcript_1704/g.2131 Transcript_1704/m.2131 type:complete len:99 (-) Transcript_1704:1460-1756(-)
MNSGKIDSHQWYFKGFCTYLNPTYCQMIDIGTIPLKKSISKITQILENDPQLGGACGEIEVFEPTDKELGIEYKKREHEEENRKNGKNTPFKFRSCFE